MADSDDLFNKADALLGRYRGEVKPEPDFPTLTEVVETLPAPPGPAVIDAAMPAAAAEPDLEALRARLLERLQPELEVLLSTAIEAGRVRFEDQLRLAVHELLADAEAETQSRLAERLDEAVREAMAGLRGSGG